jgi:DNA-binding beta-propeller fold protein YncE
MSEAVKKNNRSAGATASAVVPRLFVLELNAGRIHAMNTDGSDRKTIVSDCHLPDGIVVDVEAGYIYWTNMGIPNLNDGSVERADIDGKNRKTIVAQGDTHTPKQIILDKKSGKLYWCDREGIDDGTIEVAQQKTDQEDSDEKLVIPIHRNLQRELELAKRRHVVILATEWGKPFSVKGFGQFISAAIQAAGLPAKCKAHGLRKAAARRLAEAGCTAKQIQAITGHKSLEEVERYTRKADQKRLARQAMATQENNAGSQVGKPKVIGLPKRTKS